MGSRDPSTTAALGTFARLPPKRTQSRAQSDVNQAADPHPAPGRLDAELAQPAALTAVPGREGLAHIPPLHHPLQPEHTQGTALCPSAGWHSWVTLSESLWVPFSFEHYIPDFTVPFGSFVCCPFGSSGN